MDISAKTWELEKNYQKHDIVKVDNLSAPNEIDKYSIAAPNDNNLISDKNFDASNFISKLALSCGIAGKFSGGKQSKLKSELSAFKLSLFCDFCSKFNSD